MKLEEYLDFEVSIAVGDGEEKCTVIDTFSVDDRNFLVIAPTRQLEVEEDSPEVMFVEVEKGEEEENKLLLVTDQDDYEALFEIFCNICEASNEECDDECDCDECDDECDDEEEMITFIVKTEDGEEKEVCLYDTFFYEDHKYNLCIPAEDVDKISCLIFFEVIDYEEDEDDPEFDKEWAPVDSELSEELCLYLENAYEEGEDEEE